MKIGKNCFLLWALCLLGILLTPTVKADTFTVTNANDSGINSLRWAIEQANQNPGPDNITFDNSYTIYPQSNLPSLNDTTGGTTIDGGNHRVIIDGSLTPLNQGLLINSSYNTLRNLHVRSIRMDVNNLPSGLGIDVRGNHNVIYGCKIYLNERGGIHIGGPYPGKWSANYNKIQSCFIGTSDGVTSGEGNDIYGYTIFVSFSSHQNIIGTDGNGFNDEREGNVISGNQNSAIVTAGTGTRISGNMLGTDATGSVALPNYGPAIADQGGDTIIGTDGDGVSDAYEGNLISGNIYSNRNLISLGKGSRFSGNIVGLDITGKNAIPNSAKFILAYRAGGNIIGTDSDGVSDEFERNIISGNESHGIGFPYSTDYPFDTIKISGNYIGTDITGKEAIGNSGIGIAAYGFGPMVIGTDGDGINDDIEANIISGNNTGIQIGRGEEVTRVSGNLIGTDKTGTVALPNYFGITLSNANNNIIGTNGDRVGDEQEGNIIVATSDTIRFSIPGIKGVSSLNTIAGNYLGTDIYGTERLGNGVISMGNGSHNIIGTNGDGISDGLEKNIIAGGSIGGTAYGLTFGGSYNRISGNYIGLGADGETLFGLQFGMSFGGSHHIIGTNGDGISDELEGNIIVGNGTFGNGIRMSGTENRISGNIIGTNRQGNLEGGFGGAGINIRTGASYNLIGSNGDGASDELEGNIITNNGYGPFNWAIENDGIAISNSQYNPSSYNTIQGNSIFNNAGKGIDLLNGANEGIPAPAISKATYVVGGIKVSGTAPAASTVEVFTTDPLYGDGEGQTFVNKTVADANGYFSLVTTDIYFDDIITATATDTAGNTSEFSVSTTTSGNQPPVLNPIGDQSVDEMENLNLSVTADDPEGGVVTITATNLPEGAYFDGAVFNWTPDYSQAGSYQVTFTATDELGGSDSETINLTVIAVNAPPTAAPSGGGTYRVLTDITLTGQVSDYDGESLSYRWFEGETIFCASQVDTIEGGEAVALPDCVISGGLSLGSHIVTLEVNDGSNLPFSASINIEVIDTTAPTLAPQVSRNILWPPNHKMEEITIVTNADDESGCYSIDAFVTSNEPEYGTGDGDTGPDYTNPVIDPESDTITVFLRAERAGKGDGRIYSINILATDCAGNSSNAIVDIPCPHNQKGN